MYLLLIVYWRIQSSISFYKRWCDLLTWRENLGCWLTEMFLFSSSWSPVIPQPWHVENVARLLVLCGDNLCYTVLASKALSGRVPEISKLIVFIILVGIPVILSSAHTKDWGSYLNSPRALPWCAVIYDLYFKQPPVGNPDLLSSQFVKSHGFFIQSTSWFKRI